MCPRQKASMLCGAAAQLTRIFSSRSAVRMKRSSGLTACVQGVRNNRSDVLRPPLQAPSPGPVPRLYTRLYPLHLQHPRSPSSFTCPRVQPVTKSWWSSLPLLFSWGPTPAPPPPGCSLALTGPLGASWGGSPWLGGWEDRKVMPEKHGRRSSRASALSPQPGLSLTSGTTGHLPTHPSSFTLLSASPF